MQSFQLNEKVQVLIIYTTSSQWEDAVIKNVYDHGGYDIQLINQKDNWYSYASENELRKFKDHNK